MQSSAADTAARGAARGAGLGTLGAIYGDGRRVARRGARIGYLERQANIEEVGPLGGGRTSLSNYKD